MNEQAIRDAYNLAVSDGYVDSIDDFKNLIRQNEQALQDVFNLAVSDGYVDGIDDFKILMGVTTPSKKKDTTGLSLEGGSLVLPESYSEQDPFLTPEREEFLKAVAEEQGVEYVPTRSEEQAEADKALSTEILDETIKRKVENGEELSDFELQRFSNIAGTSIITEKPNLKIEKPEQTGRDMRKTGYSGPDLTDKENYESALSQRNLDIAKTIQNVAEEAPFLEQRQKLESERDAANQQRREALVNSEPFQKELSLVTKELISLEEEEVVPKMNKQFGRYGFVFKEVGIGDKMEVLAANGEVATIDLDVDVPYFQAVNSKELMSFIERNALAPRTVQTFNPGMSNETAKDVEKFFKDRGFDYAGFKSVYDSYTDARDKAIFVDLAPFELSELSPEEQERFGEFYINGKLRHDAYDKQEFYQDKANSLVAEFKDSDMSTLQEDFDKYMHDAYKKRMDVAIEAGNAMTEAQENLEAMSQDAFGMDVNSLIQYVPKNESEYNKKQDILTAYRDSLATRDLAAKSYMVANSYLDAKFDKQVKDEWVENYQAFRNAITKGSANGEVADIIMLMSLGITDISDDATLDEKVEAIIKNLKEGDTGKMGRASYRYQQAKGYREIWEAFKDDPLELASSFVAESLSQLLPVGKRIIPTTTATGVAIGATRGGKIGAIAGGTYGLRSGMAATNAALEYSNAIMDAVRTKGYNPMDPDSLKAALQDPKVWELGSSIGIRRGLAIGVVDYLTSGLAGRLFTVGKTANKTARVASRVSERLLYDPIAEGTGEFVAQVLSGQEVDGKEIIAESIGGLGSKSPVAAFNMYVDLKTTKDVDKAKELSKIDGMAAALESDEDITNWANNLEKMGKITPEQNQAIQKNIGTKREADDILAIGDKSKEVPQEVRSRVMKLVAAKQELTASKERSVIFSEKISEINKELQEIAISKEVKPEAEQTIIDGIIELDRDVDVDVDTDIVADAQVDVGMDMDVDTGIVADVQVDEGVDTDVDVETDVVTDAQVNEATDVDVTTDADVTVSEPTRMSENLFIKESDNGDMSNKSRRTVFDIATRAAKSISKALPDTRIVLYDSNNDFQEATGTDGAGFFGFDDNTIHVNLDKANIRTVPHEVFHAVLYNKLGEEGVAKSISKMARVVQRGLPKDSEVAARVNDFVQQYEADPESIQDEERVSELFGIMASEYKTLSKPSKNAIIKFIQDIARKFGILDVITDTDESVIDLMNTLSEKVREGKEILEEDVKTLEELDNGTNPIGKPTTIRKPKQTGREQKNTFSDSHKYSLITPDKSFDFMSLINDIADKKQKVWFWVADQLGIDKELGIDAGPSFAYQKEGDIWASSVPLKRVNNLINQSDYLFIISGSPTKSHLFNKNVFDLYTNRLGNYETFKKEALNTNPTKPIRKILSSFNSWEELRSTPKRKDFLIALNQQSGVGTKFNKYVSSLDGFIDPNSLRDGFYRDNDYIQGDVMLVLKPTDYVEGSNHSTYSNTVLGEVVGVPDIKVDAFDLMPEKMVREAEGLRRSQRQEKIAPMGIGVREISKKRGRQQKKAAVTPETSSNYANLTEDGNGNFVFYHVGQDGYETIKPSSGNNRYTGREEASALSKVGGLAMFYPDVSSQESMVTGNVKYEIKVPMDNVYDYDTDPMGYKDEAKRIHDEEHPGKGYTKNDELAYVTRLANSDGFDMVVSEWSGGTRAQTTKELTPTDKRITSGGRITQDFDEVYESNKDKGFVPVIPKTKSERLREVYRAIYDSRNKEGRYDKLYHLKSDYRNMSQDEITQMIESSDINSELKAQYRDAIKEDTDVRRSVVQKPKAGRKQKLSIEEIESPTGREQRSRIEDATENGQRIVTDSDITLFRGTKSKTKNGKPFSVHEIKKGKFAALDRNISLGYKGDKPLKIFEIPSGTTVEVVKLPIRQGATAFRRNEENAIDASDAQVVKLITLDASGKENQYIVKDDDLLAAMRDETPQEEQEQNQRMAETSRGREQKLSIEDVVKKSRDNGMRDVAIADYLTRVLGYSAKEVKKALNPKSEETPKAFKSISGGEKAGTKLYNRVREYQRKLAEKNSRNKKNPMTEQQMADKVIEFLESQPEYKAEAEVYKRNGDTKAKRYFSTQQAKMVSEFQRAVGLRPTEKVANKIAQARRAVTERERGARGLQEAKSTVRSLIRKIMPPDMYSKREVIELIRKVDEATEDNIENILNEIQDIAVNKVNKNLSQKIDNILNGRYTKRESGRVKGKRISAEVKARIDSIKSMIVPSDLSEAEYLDRLNNLIGEMMKIKENELTASFEELEKMADMQLAIDLSNIFSMDSSSKIKLGLQDAVLDNLVSLIELGRMELTREVEAKKKQRNDEASILYEEVTGVKVDFNEDTSKEQLSKEAWTRNNEKERERVNKRLKTFFKQLGRKISLIFTSTQDIEGMMDLISTLPGEMFGGRLQTLVRDRIDEASRMFKGRVMMQERIIKDKLFELYGKNWAKKSRQYNEAKEVNVYRYTETGREQFVLSQNQMYYLYNQFKDPANRKAFENMYGEQYETTMAEMEAALEPEVKAFADWQVNEFFPSVSEHYNKTYRKMYGANMPLNENYAGRIFRDGVEPEALDLLSDGGMFKPTADASSTKARQFSSKPIQPMNGTDVLAQYIKDMEYFAAYAEPIQDINAMFTNSFNKKAIEDIHGKEVWQLVDTLIKRIADRGGRTTVGDRLVNAFNTIFVVGRVALSPVILIKQLTSFVTYMNDIGYSNWVTYAAKNMTELREVYKEVRDNSVYMQDRKNESIFRVIESYSDNSMKSFVPNPHKEFYLNVLMWTTKFGDRAAIFMGGLPNYSYYKAQALRQGKTEQQAIDIAVRKFELDTKRTQQSQDLQNKDVYQTSNPIVRSMNMFMTTPRQYLRKEIIAVRNLWRKLRALDKNAGKGTIAENIRTLVMYKVVAPVLFQYVSMGLPGLLRPKRDGDEEDLIRAAVLGNLNGLFILGEIFTGLADLITKKPYAMEDTRAVGILQISFRMGKLWKRYEKAKSFEKKAENLEKVMLEAMTLTGLPAPTLKRMIDNYSRVGSDKNVGENILRLLNYSEYQISGSSKPPSKEDLMFPELKEEKDRIKEETDRIKEEFKKENEEILKEIESIKKEL